MCPTHTNTGNCDLDNQKVSYLRWDRANLATYCELTRVHLTQILCDLREVEHVINTDMIDCFCNTVINVLQSRKKRTT